MWCNVQNPLLPLVCCEKPKHCFLNFSCKTLREKLSINNLKEEFKAFTTSKDDINLIYMTFNDFSVENEFHQFLSVRREFACHLIGIFMIVAQIGRLILVFATERPTNVIGALVGRLLGILVTGIVASAKFPALCKFSPKIRSITLVFLSSILMTITMTIQDLSRRTKVSDTFFVTSIIMAVMMPPFQAVLLVSGPKTLLFLTGMSFVWVYTMSRAVNSDSSNDQDADWVLILLLSFALASSIAVVQSSNVSLRHIFIMHKQAIEATLRLQRANLNTELAQIEAIKTKADAMQSKIDFISSLAHDTANPLSALDTIVTKLKEVSRQIPAIAPCMSIMALCVTMLRSSRQRSMDCARSKDGDYEKPTYAPVELYPLLRDLNGMMNLFMSRRAVQFTFQIETYLVENRVYSCPDWLSDMILNFINNANKYTESGTIVVSVYRVSDGCGICFEVADTGPGIENKFKTGLFNKFARVETMEVEEEKMIQDQQAAQVINKKFVRSSQSSDSIPSQNSSGNPSPVSKVVSFFFARSKIRPYAIENDRNPSKSDESQESAPSPNNLASSQVSVRSQRPKKNEVKGTGLGLFGVLMKATKFGGYVAIQDNVPNGVIFSFTVPLYLLTRGMVKLDKGSMDRISGMLPHVGVNESGVALPPPNADRLAGLTFVLVTGAVDSSALEFEIVLPSSIEPIIESKGSEEKEDQSDWPAILVIDDSSSIRKVWVGAMKKKKHRVIECENGEQGVERMKEFVFPFVVTDMQMPKMNGLQAIAEIREYERADERVGKNRQVIIFCSGGVDDELRGRAMSAGADIIADKPSNHAALFEEAMKMRALLDSATAI